ncbi:type II and III secretion system protein family protein [Vibrio sp. 10N.261.55.A7]|uniref:type II and III secretion system protein family protein n=1 Tax=Vibrio sp. 10N.261.55.A7 TaxID=1880851 RepID=UPI000C824786|nr:type II and III secretion system protein family protein [Vibrio sp. 10N.261.55.A7]PMJ96400.1 hypothetical protein BCU12_04825 [Vibrio sp. 10N.261.55.A7]
MLLIKLLRKAKPFPRLTLWLAAMAFITPTFLFAADISSAKTSQLLFVGQAKKLSLNSAANTVFISDPEIASYQATSANTIILFARQPGTTSLFVLDDKGRDIYSTDIIVGYDTSHLSPMLKREFPNANIQVRAHGDSVMLTGTVPDAQTASQAVELTNRYFVSMDIDNMESAADKGNESVGNGAGTSGLLQGRVINRLSISAPTQVNIRVRIAEVSKQVKENFGFQWNYASETVKDSLNSITFGLTRDLLWKESPIVGEFAGSDAVGMVDILAQENLVTVLAEPNLTATSGETASFLAGGEVPQIISGGSDEAPTIEYKQFGVQLAVTPTILSGNRIALKVKTEISDISASNSVTIGGSTQQGFDIRRAETSVELASGQSFALAGLVKRNVTDELTNLPWVNQIPVLGRLFESSRFRNNETELVIIASAYLVEPTQTPLATPIDNAHLTSPFERLIFGRTLKPIEGYERPPAAIASEAFKGFEF